MAGCPIPTQTPETMAETPAASSAAAVPDQFNRQPRLPTTAVRHRYALLLVPDLAACTFTGSVSITLSVTDPTPFVVLNSLDLAVDSASVILRTPGRETWPRDVVLDAEDERLVLGFADPIPIGDAVLDIGFSGVLNDHMRGFYRSKYEVDGVARNMAVTPFEAVEASRCFRRRMMDAPANDRLFLFEMARKNAETAYAKNPLDAKNLARWGGALLEISQVQSGPNSVNYIKEAVVRLEEALHVNLRKHDALWCLGNTYTSHAFFTPENDVASGFFKEATECFRKALEEDPENDLYVKSLDLSLKVVAIAYAIMTTRSLELSWKMRAIRVMPMFVLPGLSSVFYSTL